MSTGDSTSVVVAADPSVELIDLGKPIHSFDIQRIFVSSPLDGSRYDLSTYWGRVQHMQESTSMRYRVDP